MTAEEKKVDWVQVAKLLLYFAGAVLAVWVAGWGAATLSAETRTVPARMSAVEVRLDRVDARMDSLLRVSAQSWCLQKAQAQGTDWRECVR